MSPPTDSGRRTRKRRFRAQFMGGGRLLSNGECVSALPYDSCPCWHLPKFRFLFLGCPSFSGVARESRNGPHSVSSPRTPLRSATRKLSRKSEATSKLRFRSRQVIEKMVTLTSSVWNQIARWLRQHPMMAEQRAEAGWGHDLAALAAFQGDEQRG